MTASSTTNYLETASHCLNDNYTVLASQGSGSGQAIKHGLEFGCLSSVPIYTAVLCMLSSALRRVFIPKILVGVPWPLFRVDANAFATEVPLLIRESINYGIFSQGQPPGQRFKVALQPCAGTVA